MASSITLVRDLMTVGVPSVSPDMAADEVARLILEKELEAVIVLNPEDGHAVGYISREELATAYSRRLENHEEDTPYPPASAVMKEDIPQVPADIPLTAAAHIMHDLRVRVLFIMHHAGGIIYPAAILTYAHLLRHLAARDPEELKDLGIRAERKTPLEQFLTRREEALKKVKRE